MHLSHLPGLIEKTGAFSAIAAVGGGAAAQSIAIAVVMVPFVVGGIGAAIWGARQKGNIQGLKDAGHAWREERDAERAKAERLERELIECVHEISKVREELEGRPEMQAIIAAIEKGDTELLSALKENTEAIRFLATNLAAN